MAAIEIVSQFVASALTVVTMSSVIKLSPRMRVGLTLVHAAYLWWGDVIEEHAFGSAGSDAAGVTCSGMFGHLLGTLAAKLDESSSSPLGPGAGDRRCVASVPGHGMAARASGPQAYGGTYLQRHHRIARIHGNPARFSILAVLTRPSQIVHVHENGRSRAMLVAAVAIGRAPSSARQCPCTAPPGVG